MSTYELDDVTVQRFLESWGECISGPEIVDLINAIKPQVPVPVPPYIGAMVRTADGEKLYQAGVYIRWATDKHTTSPWIRQSDHEQPYRTDEIGRIVRVLCAGHEGVELG